MSHTDPPLFLQSEEQVNILPSSARTLKPIDFQHPTLQGDPKFSSASVENNNLNPYVKSCASSQKSHGK